jgi:hypothetical protein
MQLKQLGVTLALAGMLSTQAYAHEAAVSEAAPLAAAAVQAAPANVLTHDDLVALFGAQEAQKPLQLALLSEQEMRETEGAFLPFVIGAGIGLVTYAAPLAYSAARNTWSGNGTFTSNFRNSWDTRQAIFSSGVGALSGGVANIALRSTGTIINYPATTFLKSFHTPMQQFVNNQIRTYTTAPGLAIKGASSAGSYGANSWYNSIRR